MGVIFCCNRLKVHNFAQHTNQTNHYETFTLTDYCSLDACLYSGAAINNTGKVLGRTPGFLSAKYTFDKKTQLISVDYDYNYDGEVPSETKVNILDYKFNQIKTITIQPGAAVTATTTRKLPYEAQKTSSKIRATKTNTTRSPPAPRRIRRLLSPKWL